MKISALKKDGQRRTRWWRSRWTWSTSLSTNTSRTPLQTRKCMQNTHREWTGGPDQRKRIYRTHKLGRRKELGGKRGVLVGLDLPSAGGGTEAGVPSPRGAIVWVGGEAFKAESERADLWQPKWNENQKVLAAAIHTLDRDIDPLEGAVAGSWSLGIVEQSQGEGCCWLQRDG